MDIGIIMIIIVVLLHIYALLDYISEQHNKKSCKDCFYYIPGGRCLYYHGSHAFEGKHNAECFANKKG